MNFVNYLSMSPEIDFNNKGGKSFGYLLAY